MSGDVHVRFCEHLEGRFLGATRLICHCVSEEQAWALNEALAQRVAQGLVKLTV